MSLSVTDSFSRLLVSTLSVSNLVQLAHILLCAAFDILPVNCFVIFFLYLLFIVPMKENVLSADLPGYFVFATIFV